MPTPEQLTQTAYDMGVAGADLNTIMLAIADSMESSGEYYGPYDLRQKIYVQQYLIEEITPDRIRNLALWLKDYTPPSLGPIVISNGEFYVGDGPGTYIGQLSGMTAGSTIEINDNRIYLDSSYRVYIGIAEQNQVQFDVVVSETLLGAANSTRQSVLSFDVVLNLTDAFYLIDDSEFFLSDDNGALIIVSNELLNNYV